jgi:8-oxo-dGTP pyrophosphatase MutT (NUDIX family)
MPSTVPSVIKRSIKASINEESDSNERIGICKRFDACPPLLSVPLIPMKNVIPFLEEKLAGKLPGEAAHQLMSPRMRQTKQQAISAGITPRLSAVMVLIYPRNEVPHLVLMKRPEYDGAHSGQVSFPGGKKEEEDVDLSATALRETEEETGINRQEITVIGQLTELFIPPSGFLVAPFVGYLNEPPVFIPDEREVAELIEMPIDLLLDEAIVDQKKIHIKSHNIYIDSPYFNIQDHVVWGATCMMLSELKEILRKKT